MGEQGQAPAAQAAQREMRAEAGGRHGGGLGVEAGEGRQGSDAVENSGESTARR